MITLYLIRHGQTDWNREQRFQGRFDIDLNQEGLKQIRQLSTNLSNAGLTRIYTSPLKRAYNSANVISATTAAPVVQIDDLIEIDYGLWQGRTHEEIKSSSPELYEKWINHPWDIELPDGEPTDQFYKRVSLAIDDIINVLDKDSTIAVCTHGHVLRVIMLHLLKLDQSQFWQIEQENGQCSVLTCRDRSVFKCDDSLALKFEDSSALKCKDMPALESKDGSDVMNRKVWELTQTILLDDYISADDHIFDK